MPTVNELGPEEIRTVLLRHEGSISWIAEKLEVRASTVSVVLSGRAASKRIISACRRKALSLLEQERAQEAKGAA